MEQFSNIQPNTDRGRHTLYLQSHFFSPRGGNNTHVVHAVILYKHDDDDVSEGQILTLNVCVVCFISPS